MKPTKRKLSLNQQTLRNLTPAELHRVAGAVSSAQDSRCSTWNDTGCCTVTAADSCNTLRCPTGTCPTGYC